MTPDEEDYDNAIEHMANEARKRPLAIDAFIFQPLEDGTALYLAHLNNHDKINFEFNHDVEDMEKRPRAKIEK